MTDTQDTPHVPFVSTLNAGQRVKYPHWLRATEPRVVVEIDSTTRCLVVDLGGNLGAAIVDYGKNIVTCTPTALAHLRTLVQSDEERADMDRAKQHHDRRFRHHMEVGLSGVKERDVPDTTERLRMEYQETPQSEYRYMTLRDASPFLSVTVIEQNLPAEETPEQIAEQTRDNKNASAVGEAVGRAMARELAALRAEVAELRDKKR